MDRTRAREVLARLELPSGFLFGVATAPHQVEGGLNGPGEPRNNWAPWERSGRAEPAGRTNDFWHAPEGLLDRAAALGLNAFRLGLEWTRLEPSPGQRDTAALRRYAEIILGCRRRGLEPVVTLHHFTHPAWLGESPWTRADGDGAVRRFVDHIRRTVDELGRAMVAAGEQPPRLFVTLDELNILPLTSFIAGVFPPGGTLDLGRAALMLDRLATAHVLAYDAIHEVHDARGWPSPLVTTNNYCLGLYELDRLLLDLLTARERGVDERELGADLRRRRRGWNRRLELAPRPAGSRRWLERLLRPLFAALLREGLPGCRAALYRSPRPRKLDLVALDYYDPFPECFLRWPGRRSGLGRAWQPLAELWETPVNPPGLRWFLGEAAGYGLPLVVMENGLCNERGGARAAPRSDGWTRSRYLREHLLVIAAALVDGLPLLGYFHWTLADNYEWGSYRARFGLLGRDDRDGALEEVDSMGEPSAQLYGALCAALRGTDRDRRKRLFLGDARRPALSGDPSRSGSRHS